MTSLFRSNQTVPLHEPLAASDEQRAALEQRDREIAALKQQLQALKSFYAKGPGSLPDVDPSAPQAKPYFAEAPLGVDHIKQRNDRMMAVLADRERQMKELQAEYKDHKIHVANELQKERQTKLAQKDEIAALHGQVEFLKNKYTEGQRLIAELKNDLELLRGAHSALMQENGEAMAAREKLKALQRDFEKVLNDSKISSEAHEATIRELKEFEALATADQNTILDLQQAIAELENRLHASTQLVDELSGEKSKLQERAFNAQNEKDDAEARLKIAHFHLAKKVKETNLLEDHAATFRTRSNELAEDLAEAKKHLALIHQEREEDQQEENRRYQALIASLQQAEAETKDWKEKYFMGMDKWKSQEQRLAELKLMEEKLLKMKSLWSGFGNFFDDPPSQEHPRPYDAGAPRDFP